MVFYSSKMVEKRWYRVISRHVYYILIGLVNYSNDYGVSYFINWNFPKFMDVELNFKFMI